MRILYGVVGEGMGHATRSCVVLDHLLARGHQVKVVVSGRAHDFLARRFAQTEGITIEEIAGLHMVYRDNEVQRRESLRSNLSGFTEGYQRNYTAYQRVVGSFPAEVVISDFESWAWYYGRRNKVPVISIDNMQIINRCAHDRFVTDDRDLDFQLAKLAVKAKVPGCYHYLVSSFFFPPVRKKRTSLLPPILRSEILAARREPDEHVLVYQTAATNSELVPLLNTLPYTFRLYGMNVDAEHGNVQCRAFSNQGFVDDLRTARAVLAGGGYSLMGECVHLGVPLMSIPLVGQYEQELNARYLQKLGYGRFAEAFTADGVRDFLEGAEAHADALSAYERADNSMLLRCVDEVLRRVELGEAAPAALDSPTRGDWIG